MKILYITTYLVPFMTYPIVKLNKAHGIDYFVYFCQNKTAYLMHKDYRKMWDTKKYSVMLDPDKYKIIKLFMIPKRIFKPFFDYLKYRIIYREVRNKGFDIIHAHDIDPSALIAYKISKKLNIPFVITEHGPEWYSKQKPTEIQKQKIINKYALAMENAFAVLSNSEKFTDFLKSYWNKANVRTVCPTYNTFVFNTGNAGILPAINEQLDNMQARCLRSQCNLLTIGSFIPIKNHLLLLRAINILKETYPNIHLTMIGEGVLKSDYQKFITEHQLENFITIKDFMPHHDLVKEYYNADFYVQTSYKETFGVVLLEALATGVNVVASQTDGAIAIIDDEVNGLVFENDNLDYLLAKIIFLIQNPQKRDELKEQGFLKAKQYENKIEEVYQVYQESISFRQNTFCQPIESPRYEKNHYPLSIIHYPLKLNILYLSTIFTSFIHYPIVKLEEDFAMQHFTYFFMNQLGYLFSKKYRELWSTKNLTVALDPNKYEIIKLYRLPRRVLKWIYPYIMYLCIYPKVKKGNFDIIHAHAIDPNGILAYKLSKKLKIPFVITEHGPEWYNDNSVPTEKQKQTITRKYADVVENAAALIAVSESFADFLKSFWEKANVVTIHNTFDSTIFNTGNAGILPAIDNDLCNLQARCLRSQCNLISVGTFCDRKNHILLLKAINKLKGKYPNIHLTIIGSGSLKDYYLEYVTEHQLSEFITIKDFMPHHLLVEEYHRSDIFVLTSLKETFGIVILEAMSSGVVVVGARTDGTSTIIEDEIDGLIFENNDLDDLCSKISLLIDDPNLMNAIREKAFEKAKSFSQKHHEVYGLYQWIMDYFLPPP